MRVVLASASPARLQLLERAGISVDVLVSHADEDSLHADNLGELVQRLAELKGTTVIETHLASVAQPTLVVAADSMLDFAGKSVGKPSSPEDSRRQWQQMRGQQGTLLTGQFAALFQDGEWTSASRLASTKVWFADVSDDDIDAYVKTGEPGRVAGSFTIDSLGAPFVAQIEGDYGTVVGLSLPTLRLMFADLGVSWTSLWSRGSTVVEV